MSTATPDEARVPVRARSDADLAIPAWLRADPLGVVLATHPADELVEEFGPDRVRSCAIAEESIVGIAIGAAVAGFHPLVDLARSGFTLVAADQILNHAAHFRYISNGQVRLQVTLKALTRLRYLYDPHPALYGCFDGQPGLKVMLPGTSDDAPGLLRSALEDPNPVFFFDSFHLVSVSGRRDERVPLGRARKLVGGDDATVLALGCATELALAAAEQLVPMGLTCDVIDVLSLNPLDVETVRESVMRTGTLIIVDEAPYPAPAAQRIIAETLADDPTFARLRCAPRTVTSAAAPLPASPDLRRVLLPNVADVVRAVLACARVSTSSPPN